MKKCIVIGAGLAGAVISEQMSNNGYNVSLYEKRDHIGGNVYDCYDENQILIHPYGPHLFFTSKDSVWEYVQQFSEWKEFRRAGMTCINGKYIPFLFNLNSIDLLFPEEAKEMRNKLLERYQDESLVPILELLQCDDPLLSKMAKTLFQLEFSPYTQKQWGIGPFEVNESVLSRTPFYVSTKNVSSTGKYVYLPSKGYTRMFERMLSNKNITITLNHDALTNLTLVGNELLWNNEKADYPIIFTGCIDQLCQYKYGKLPYRSIEFTSEIAEHFPAQPTWTVAYPDLAVPFTRRTEYRYIMDAEEQPEHNKSILVSEIPMNYDPDAPLGNIPYYPMPTDKAKRAYEQYRQMLIPFKNLYLAGRLACYQYYNMDLAIEQALEIAQKLIHQYS